MAYNAIWHEESLKDLKKLNRTTAKKIVTKVKNYLIQDPLKSGIPLKGNLKGFYRYRIGEYRVIYVIDQAEKKIIILMSIDRISELKKGIDMAYKKWEKDSVE